jgi:ribose transport system permease protein
VLCKVLPNAVPELQHWQTEGNPMTSSQTSTEPASARRLHLSRGLVTILVAVVLLYICGQLFASSSVSKGALLGMLPFASVLAIAALGQTLVVQQGGIDLSVAGAISASVVICTHQPNGQDSRLLGAVLFALLVAIVAGIVNGLLIGRLGLNSIVATLGTNALLYAVVLGVSGGTPRHTTRRLASLAGGTTFGLPNSFYVAVVVVVLTAVLVKATVAGRWFEATGANVNAALASGLRIMRHRTAAYVWAQLLYWLAGVLLAGIVTEPSAFQGDAYLLPTVAAVVLGGTSLLGGHGQLVASAVAALFLQQLQQFVLALGVNFGVRTLVQAGALTVGVALYTINWRGVGLRLRPSGRPAPAT